MSHIYTLFDSSLDSIVVISHDGLIQYTNEAFANLFESTPKRLIGKKNIRDLSQFTDSFWRLIDETKIKNEISPYIEIDFLIGESKDHSSLVTIQPSPINEQLTNTPHMVLTFRDVSLEKVLQQKYKRELNEKEAYINRLNRKLFEVSYLLEVSSILTGQTDIEIPMVDQLLAYTNATFKFKSSYFLSRDEARNHELRIEAISGQSEMNESLISIADVDNERQSIEIKGKIFLKIEVKRKNDKSSFLLFEISDDSRKIIAEDLDLIKNMASQLSMSFDNEVLYLKSITDEKTKLYNPRYFHVSLKNEVIKANRGESVFGLILIDIDHFKKFNDTYGHATGDVVLKVVAQQIKSATRNSDIAARFGGEEFAVIILKTNLDGIHIAAERIRQSIENAIVSTTEHGNLKVTASVGAALCPIHATTENDIIEAADKALYQAKHAGRNNSKIFTKT